MSKRNENRPGYKKTKVGWIPEEWNCQHLHNLCTASGQYGACAPAIPYLNEAPRYIRITDITDNGNLLNINKVSIPPDSAVKYFLSFGDFLFARTGATVGKTYLHDKDSGQYAFAGYLIRFIPDENLLLGVFLKNYTQTDRYYYWVKTTLHAGAQPNINAAEYGSLSVPVPPLPEQKKIAEILSTWDEAIEQTRKLIDAKKRRKKALMQELLTGKKRFKDNGGNDWRIRSFGELVEPVSRPIPKPKEPYLSIGIRSHGKGTFQKIVELPEKVMMDTLYRIDFQDLVTNITFAWEGAIAIATERDKGGLVSHRFPTYRFREKEADIGFFSHLILSKKFVWDLGLISPGGAGRNRVMSKKNFLKLKVFVPSIEIQEEIGKILTTADNKIKALENYRNTADKQKRGLMQKLLTGEVRVSV
ncbi:MAG: type I restriction enzyme, S subunit [Desulfobacteraceae bacterium Eth-SRB2]|nr:MAG: type I restriction enzyme, S subunit [Desulfobacteraceae bacterium Eth-SRB2]